MQRNTAGSSTEGQEPRIFQSLQGTHKRKRELDSDDGITKDSKRQRVLVDRETTDSPNQQAVESTRVSVSSSGSEKEWNNEQAPNPAAEVSDSRSAGVHARVEGLGPTEQPPHTDAERIPPVHRGADPPVGDSRPNNAPVRQRSVTSRTPSPLLPPVEIVSRPLRYDSSSSPRPQPGCRQLPQDRRSVQVQQDIQVIRQLLREAKDKNKSLSVMLSFLSRELAELSRAVDRAREVGVHLESEERRVQRDDTVPRPAPVGN